MRHDDEFSEFFAARGPALRRTAYLILRDWHAAEDATQQALAKLYVAWPRVRAETLDAYARRAVVNEAITLVRKPRREALTQAPPERAAATHPDAPIDLGEALALVSPQQRAILALRFLDDLPVADVAAALDIAEGTVKSQTSRALVTLRAHLPQLVLTEETS